MLKLMIRYSLVCSNAHEFEGWFRSSEDFDVQSSAGLCACPECGSTSVGKALMRLSMDAARQRGHRLVVLVGDLPYYQPFGFGTVPAGRVILPGPVDPARLLWAELVPGASGGVGGLVRATGPAGEITAGKMTLDQDNQTPGSYVLVFTQGVRLLYQPDGARP